MHNKAMQTKLTEADCIDVRKAGKEVRPGFFELTSFEEDMDYCDAEKERWIWSIGRRKSDGVIHASYETDLYCNPDYECLFLR